MFRFDKYYGGVVELGDYSPMIFNVLGSDHIGWYLETAWSGISIPYNWNYTVGSYLPPLQGPRTSDISIVACKWTKITADRINLENLINYIDKYYTLNISYYHILFKFIL